MKEVIEHILFSMVAGHNEESYLVSSHRVSRTITAQKQLRMSQFYTMY